jgi:hypothetical protein
MVRPICSHRSCLVSPWHHLPNPSKENETSLKLLPGCRRSTLLPPLEIRHTPNKLDLIRRLLTSSEDAFRHSEIVLELADKLGVSRPESTANVEILGMLAEAAVKAGEYEIADTHCHSIIVLVRKRHVKADEAIETKKKEVCWKSCVLIGRQAEYANIGAKMELLGRAIEYCPPRELPAILEIWRKVEDGQIRLGEAAKRRRLAGITNPAPISAPTSSTPMSPARSVDGEKRVLGSRTAARLAMNFGERLRQYAPSPVLSESGMDDNSTPAKRTSMESERDVGRPALAAIFDEAVGAEEGERMRHQARRALVKGVGWLLGADEKEIGG